ncbi:MAG: Ig-like domain-containing protein [Oscillospiraceae bacterium]|nr:Ig-like domain-containing protein [Oscillospiraceae bacterium]
MKTVRKPFSIVISFAVIINIIAFMPVASSAAVQLSFDEYIISCLENYTQGSIDVIAYVKKIGPFSSQTEAQAAVKKESDRLLNEFVRVLNENPQLFHVKTYGVVGKTHSPFTYNTATGEVKFTEFTIHSYSYNMTKTQYTNEVKKFNNETQKALAYAKTAQTDFEKALAVYDYLVLTTAYDKENLDHAIKSGTLNNPLRPLSHSSYGSLVSKLAICEGYAKAYMHVMNLLGVECKLITGVAAGNGAKTNHMWNQIKINGKWYHVDVTWGDPLFTDNETKKQVDLYGFIDHSYFLLSDTALKNIKSHEWTGGIQASSTTYDKDFAKNAGTAVIKLGDSFYWIESDKVTSQRNRGYNNNYIKRYTISTKKITTVYSYEAIWYIGGTENENRISFYSGSYSSLAAYNGKLYFNTAKQIFTFDPKTNTATAVSSSAGLGGKENKFIYGLTMSGNKITYTVKTRPGMTDTFKSVTVAAAKTTSVSLDKTALTLNVKETAVLKATLNPANSGDYIYWISSAPEIASVDENGKVTAVKKGTATITAFTANDKQKTCAVTVK